MSLLERIFGLVQKIIALPFVIILLAFLLVVEAFSPKTADRMTGKMKERMAEIKKEITEENIDK